MYNRKAFLEETINNTYKKIHLEEGSKDESPDYVHELKQGLAKNGMAFMNGFISAIPAIVIIIILMFILIMYIIF